MAFLQVLRQRDNTLQLGEVTPHRISSTNVISIAMQYKQMHSGWGFLLLVCLFSKWKRNLLFWATEKCYRGSLCDRLKTASGKMMPLRDRVQTKHCWNIQQMSWYFPWGQDWNRHLSKLASINFGRQLPLSSPKPTLTARHSISSVHNGNTMLDMNEDVDIFTENTTGYIVSGTDPWKRRILAFFLIVQNLVPLTINSKRPLTSWYHSEKWKDKRGQRDSHAEVHQRVPQREPGRWELWEFRLTCKSCLSKGNSEAQMLACLTLQSTRLPKTERSLRS